MNRYFLSGLIAGIALLASSSPAFAVFNGSGSISFTPSGSGSSASSCTANPTCGGIVSWTISGGSPTNARVEQIVNSTATEIYNQNNPPASDNRSVIISQGSNVFRLTIEQYTTEITITGITATPTTNPIQLTDIQVSTGQNNATITWKTNVAADSSIDYGTSTSYGANVNNSGALTTSHSLTLNNLTTGTTYNYEIKSRASGNTGSSGNKTFVTNAQNSGGSSSSSSPTATPTTKPASSTTQTSTPTPVSGSSVLSASDSVDEEADDSSSSAVLGEETEEIVKVTPSPKEDEKSSSNLPITPITIGLLILTSGVLFVLTITLQALGVLKIGFLDKILRFFMGPS